MKHLAYNPHKLEMLWKIKQNTQTTKIITDKGLKSLFPDAQGKLWHYPYCL